jgi:hypothetical protein
MISIPLRKIPAEAKIIYKNNMTLGDAYLFRSVSLVLNKLKRVSCTGHLNVAL